jgi:hypothetical protein
MTREALDLDDPAIAADPSPTYGRRLLSTFVLTPGRLRVSTLGQIKAFHVLPFTIGDGTPIRSAASGGR